MKRTLLKFENIQQVIGSDDISVVQLTDEERKRSLSIVCDEQMTRQIMLRLQSPDKCSMLLPETLIQMLPGKYEMMIYGLHDGQYQVVLADSEFVRNVRIRISDAVLLSIQSDVRRADGQSVRKAIR